MAKAKKKFKASTVVTDAQAQPIATVGRAQINKPPSLNVTTLKASLIIAVLGFVVFFSGLSTPFIYDDMNQIVNNVPVHSISNIGLFFQGGTFYSGGGLSPLFGIYYRPLMTTVFSLIYAVFGLHTIAFHLFQLILCIASTVFLFLFFRYSFKPVLALTLALVFLLHPLDSHVVFAIPAMQDALFFFFGILGLWLLVRFESTRKLLLVAGCLLLSLFSKESGMLFVAVSLLYLLWFDRRRLYPFIGIMVLPIVLYLVLKVQAVGLNTPSSIAPIDNLDLFGRLLAAPSILAFYLAKFVFPVKLASAYYWVNPSLTVQHFLVPLIFDLAILAIAIYLAFVIRKRATRAQFLTYLFFSAWASMGLLLHLQILPLDMTAAEPWFYFPMAGVLGMIGIAITTLAPSTLWNRKIVSASILVLLVLLGVRTAIRGLDWSSAYKLASQDIAASKEDYVAYNELSIHSYDNKDFNQAKVYAQQSIDIFPSANSYNALAQSLVAEGNYRDAQEALISGINQEGQGFVVLYENLATLTSVYGYPNTNKQILLNAIDKYPRDANLWYYLALLEYKQGDPAAKDAAGKALRFGPSNQAISALYNKILNGIPIE